MRKNLFRVVSYLILSIFVGVAFVHPGISAAAPVNLQFCDQAGTGFNAPGCSGGQDLTVIITAVMNIVFFLSFILVLFFLVWGGLKWVLAQGEKEGITKAREQVTNSLIGLVVILGSYLLLNLALQLVLGKKFSEIGVISLGGLLGGN